MRATLSSQDITLRPGIPTRVTLEVTNTSLVIDGLSARVDTPPGLEVTAEPALLPLFPDGVGVIELNVVASPTFPAGPYKLAVLAHSSVTPQDSETVGLRIQIQPVPNARLQAVPPVQTGRHKVEYSIVADNIGNTPLEISLAGSDGERVVTTNFAPNTLLVGPGETGTAIMAARARRHLLGGEVARQLTVIGTAGELNLDARASFRQSPVIPRGVRTVLILGTVIAVWALIFIIALDKALAKDPETKEVPPSFYAAAAATATSHAPGVPGGLKLSAAAANDAPPAGAVPKTGVVIGIGGTVNGTVLAKSTGQGIGRITVEAIADSPQGPQLISAAATGSDGRYALVGLLPGPYKLLFTSDGYNQLWYGGGTSEATATNINVDAEAALNVPTVTIDGQNGSIAGSVATGQTPQVPVTVTVLPQQGATTAIATVTSDSNGHYAIPNLPAPGNYDLSFSAAGYEVASDTEQLAGGEQRIAATINLTAGTGTLGGTVTDGTNPLGGVDITAASNGQTVTSATPTTGAVGQFAIPNLATPATYLLTFTKQGYGTQTLAEYLGPGQSINTVAIAMPGGAGQVSGTVSSPSGAPLGGVTVTVSGGTGAPISTETLTAGSVGSYQLSGLATPGNYTLTFSSAGYSSQTVAVTLGSSGSAPGVNVTLPVFSASISGTVDGTANGKTGPLTGVKVTMTNGATTQTTVTASSPAGGFAVTGLTPESWSVTLSMTGYVSKTVLVTLQPGQAAQIGTVTLESTT